MSEPKTTSIRLSESLHAGATDYAEALGIPLNSLVSIALAEYLGARTSWRAGASAGTELTGGSVGSGGRAASPTPRPEATGPKLGKHQPCHCGSGKPYGKCHGRTA